MDSLKISKQLSQILLNSVALDDSIQVFVAGFIIHQFGDALEILKIYFFQV